MNNRLIHVACGAISMALTVIAAADTKTWNPTVAEGGAYKWSTAANWLQGGAATSAPANGDSLVFDSSSAAITAVNDCTGLELAGISFAGTHDITLSGNKIDLAANGVLSAVNAPITVTLALPMDIAGMTTFSVTTNGTTTGTTFELTGSIGGAGGLATGGDWSGTYNFRAANTYAGMTYLTNGLAYNVYNGAAFGSSAVKTYYRAIDNVGGTANFDRYASTIYFHGVTINEPFDVWGNQMRSLVFMDNTTNILNGNIYSSDSRNVERWTVKPGALAVLNGTADFTSTVQLNVSTGGELIFSNTVSLTRNASQYRNCPDGGGTIRYAGNVTVTSGKPFYCCYSGGGTVSLEKADIFGFAGANVTLVTGKLQVSGGHQYFASLNATATGVQLTSSDGTEVELLAGSAVSTYAGKFSGNVVLDIADGAKLQPSNQSIGGLMTNGVWTARFQSYGATGSGADATDDGHFAGTGKLINGATIKVWNGGASGGSMDVDANWLPLGVPYAGDTVSIDGCTAGATFTGSLTLGGGGSLVVTNSPSVTFAGSIALQGSGNVTLDVADGVVAYFPGVISGSASAALVTQGGGDIHFSGENTFDGNLTVRNRNFWVESNGALGSTAGTTTLDRSAYPGDIGFVNPQRIYFTGVTNGEAIVVNGRGGQGNQVYLSGTNIFNGAWTKTAEQYRLAIYESSYTEFNEDFADIGYLTVAIASGTGANAVMVFNAGFTGGQPRLSGAATYVFTKPWTYTARTPGYGFTYSLSGGTIRLDGDYVLNRDDKTPSLRFTGSTDPIIDLYGHDEEVAAVVGRAAAGHPVVITSSTGPATLHVLNNLNDTHNSGVYGDKFSGELSVSVEGNSAKDALILAGASDSTGTLIATNGGKVVMNAGASWVGDVKICDGSRIEVANASAFGEFTHVDVEAGGALKVTSGTLEVAGLTLNGVPGVNGKTYGPEGSDADFESALLEGSGTLRVVEPIVGVTRTWRGSAGGTWNMAANWSPVGVPSNRDTLVFDSTTAAISSVNDIAGLSLAGISFAGVNSIALSGQAVSLWEGANITATACSAEITLGLGMTIPEGTTVNVTATSNATGAVTWNFTAPLSGSGDIAFGGDQSATVNFLSDNPSFDGRFYLRNATAYHVWTSGAFGSTVGATYYQVTAGSASDNAQKFVSPLWLHGITTSENFVIGGYTSYGLCAANGTTNVLNGTVDGISMNNVNLVTERWWIGTNACVRFNGAVGCSSQSGTTPFYFIILYGQPGSWVEFNGSVNGARLRQTMAASTGTLAINHPLDPATTYLGVYGPGLIKFGCADVLYADPARPVELQFSTVQPSRIDLAGHDQTFAKVFPHDYMRHVTVTNSGELATLTLMATNALNFCMSLTGDIGLCLASNVAFTLSGNLVATGPLSLMNGASLTFSGANRWIGTEVAVSDGARLVLDEARLVAVPTLSVSGGGKVAVAKDIRQSVTSLTLDGVEQTALRSYGSSQSAADVKDDAHFEGRGLVYVVGAVSDTVRTWTGPSGGSWSVAGNWTPTGVPQTGDTLVFDSTSAAVDAVNDLPLFYARSVEMKGANAISLSGNALGVFDLGGISATGVAATVACDIVTRGTRNDLAVDILPEADASLEFLGAIGGDAHISVAGLGRVDFKGANTFDGNLSVVNGEFHAYGDQVFGSTVGKTLFEALSGRDCYYWFHGISTSEAIEWNQPDGGYRGFFAAGTTNVFNGTLTGYEGGQPRMTFYLDAVAIFNNIVSNVGHFTAHTYAGSVMDVRAPFYCKQLRFDGVGSLFVRDRLVENAYPYAFAFNPGGRQYIYLLQPDVLRIGDSMLETYGAAALGMDGGTVDLCGNSQRVACFYGASTAVVTNSGAAATLHVLQTIRGNNEPNWKVPLYNGTFNGVVAGPTSLSIEGNPNPVPSMDYRSDYLVATQRLTGVSTASGALIATNSAIVSLENGGRWAGTNVVVHANSKILLGSSTALAREADVFLEADGKLVLDEGVTQRCRYLYINGVRQRRGNWGSGEAGAPAVNVIDATHFEGKGVFRAMGITGTALNFR